MKLSGEISRRKTVLEPFIKEGLLRMMIYFVANLPDIKGLKKLSAMKVTFHTRTHLCSPFSGPWPRR